MTTDLDALLAANPPIPESAVTLVRSEPRHRHVWWTVIRGIDDDLVTECQVKSCGKLWVEQAAQSRRGRSSDRLGKDNERRIEKLYGPRKVGQFGDPVDHVGRVFKWQARATRTTPQLWLSRIDEPVSLPDPPEWVTVPLNAMQPYYPELAPVSCPHGAHPTPSPHAVSTIPQAGC